MMSMEQSVVSGLNMKVMRLIMLLLCVAKVVMTRRVSHAPFASSSNKNLGHSCKWAPSRAFSSVPFDSQQEECQCQCQHPCQHSQPHSPPNIFLFIFFLISNIQYPLMSSLSSKLESFHGVNYR